MKVKTSVTLTKELLTAIDQSIGQRRNRSEFLEMAAWAYIAREQRQALDERDRDIINRNADRLNAEAADVLDYQTLP